ncbi:MAG: OsmC family protein [bacterium]
MSEGEEAPGTAQADGGDTDDTGWVTTTVGAVGFRADTSIRQHRLVVDEPTSARGTDAGPTPYEYLLTALASCTAMTLRVYADRKKWPLEQVVVRMRSAQSHLADCIQCAEAPVGISWVDRRIELTGPLTDEQRTRLMEIADRCPVKQTLERGIRIKPAS